MHFSTTRVVGLIALLALTSCINPKRHQAVVSANQKLQGQLEDLKRYNGDNQGIIADLRSKLEGLKPRVLDADYVREQKKLIASFLAKYKGETGPARLPEGVQAVQLVDGLALRVEGSVLFSSGSDKLSPSGQATLKQLASGIGDHKSKVRIAGHTDSDPIRRSSWKTNMRLSVARALSVREYLISQGVPEAKLSVAGYGEFEPVDPSNKAKNRRTEIVLLR